MNTLKKNIISAATLMTVCSALAQMEPHEWRATLKVIDEAGQPVANAETWVGYMATNKIIGLTDSNGVFVAYDRDRSFALAFHADKTGYYSFREKYEMGFPSQYNETKWNPTQTIILKKIGQPVSMYARNTRIEIPEVGKPIGFDLIEYDWVVPYGKGKQADFIFQAERRWVSRNDFDSSIKLTFSNKGDGLAPVSIPLNQGSDLRLPATAPLEDYISELSKSLSHTPVNGWIDNERDGNKEQNYYFRIRTVLDEQGNIKSALYGKIYGDFALDPINSKRIKIFFTYYLNPEPNSRNVEFNPKQNLFKHLSDREQVDAP